MFVGRYGIYQERGIRAKIKRRDNHVREKLCNYTDVEIKKKIIFPFTDSAVDEALKIKIYWQ